MVKKSVEILSVKVDSKTVLVGLVAPGWALLHAGPVKNRIAAQHTSVCSVLKLMKIITLSVFWETILNIF